MLRWLVTREEELRIAGVQAAPESILSPSELDAFAYYTVPKRRRDWLHGRWTAKRVVQHVLRASEGADLHLTEIEVPRSETGEPSLRLARQHEIPQINLSISHSGGLAAAAVIDGGRIVGIDLEPVVPRHPRLPDNFYTLKEQDLVTGAGEMHDLAVSSVWCAKEAVLKVLGVGLSITSRSVECLPEQLDQTSTRWRQCSVEVLKMADHARRLSSIDVKWTHRDGYVMAIAVGE